MTHSSAARAAVEGLTRALAREWRDDGIAVLARRGRALRHAVAAQVPRAGVEGGGAHRPAAAARARGGARVARRARGLAARPRAVGLRRSRSTARATTGSGRGRRRRSAPTAARCRRRRGSRAALSVAARASASDIPSASSRPELLPVEVAGDPRDLLRRLAGPHELDDVAAALERARARPPSARSRRAVRRWRTSHATLSASQTIRKMNSRSREPPSAPAGYCDLSPFSAIDPPPPSEIAVTLAGIDFSASISAHAGQFS